MFGRPTFIFFSQGEEKRTSRTGLKNAILLPSRNKGRKGKLLCLFRPGKGKGPEHMGGGEDLFFRFERLPPKY